MKTKSILLSSLLGASLLHAEGDANLAQQLTNPLAAMISMPVQGNVDFGIGPGGGHRMTTNIQPVVPFELSENWNLISRTILPVIDQQGTDPLTDRSDAFGLGDVVQSFFFSPKNPEPFIWGVGPVVLMPTATNSVLGADKWGLGPTGVILKIDGPWTYGMLANHIWDVGGPGKNSFDYFVLPNGVVSLNQDVNLTFIQPFVSYTTKQATTFTMNSESTYNWATHQWTVPINLQVSQLVKMGGAPVSIFGGVRWYAERAPQGPDWGARFGFTLLFPKG